MNQTPLSKLSRFPKASAFSKHDFDMYQEIAQFYPRFLIIQKFRGDLTVAQRLQRGIDKNPIITSEQILSVYVYLTWRLCFRSNTSPLWLTNSTTSPIPSIIEAVKKLGKFAPEIVEVRDDLLLFDNTNRLTVLPYYENVGHGLSATDVVMENCPSESMQKDVVSSLLPGVTNLTNGNGRIITVK